MVTNTASASCRTFPAFALALAMTWAGFAAQAAGDITGVWMIKPEYIGNRTKLVGTPEFTQPVLDMQAKRAELSKKGYVRSMGNMLCLPTGGPSLFTVRSPFEVMAGFGRISFIFETEGSNSSRAPSISTRKSTGRTSTRASTATRSATGKATPWWWTPSASTAAAR